VAASVVGFLYCNFESHSINPFMGKVKEHLQNEIENGQISQKYWFRANNVEKLTNSEVDSTNGAIYKVSVCTVGEALGHGVWLDQSFIEDIIRFGNQSKVGIKARFGHPQMSGEALGTYIGRFHNFRVKENKAIADLYLDEAAKKSPNGDLYGYILEMAAKNPDMFGASIVFSVKRNYIYNSEGQKEKVVRDEWGEILNDDYKAGDKVYVEMAAFYGADLVDEPAANPDGLFSSTKLHADKFAVIASEWLNANPNIAAFLKKNPHKITEFMKKLDANPVDETPIDDDNDDDLLLDEGKESDKVDDDEDDNKGDDQTQNTEEVEVELSKRIKALETENVSLRKLFNSLEERVKSLETDPTADPTFSAKRGDTDGGKPKQLSSWERQLDKYTKK
jgi:hypothetical protein